MSKLTVGFALDTHVTRRGQLTSPYINGKEIALHGNQLPVLQKQTSNQTKLGVHFLRVMHYEDVPVTPLAQQNELLILQRHKDPY